MESHGVLCRTVQLNAVLAGISGTGNEAGNAGNDHLVVKCVVFHGKLALEACSIENCLMLGPLERKLTPFCTVVDDLNVTEYMLLHPGKVLIGVACVDDEHIVVVGVLVDKNVIDCAAVLVAEHGIAAPAGSHGGDVVGDELLNVVVSAAADDVYLAHVGNIEQTCTLAHGLALFKNTACVLNGQRPAAEVHHLAAEVDMPLIQRSLFKIIQAIHMDSS